MSDVKLFLWIVVGVVLSVLLPIVVKWIKEFTDTEGKNTGDVSAKVWNFAKRYIKVAVASVLIAFFALVLYRAGMGGEDVINTWFKAVVYGYVWDSTFQKLRAK